MTSGDWNPDRLREARCALRDHGRPVSQARFAEMLGVSKRTLERHESLVAPTAPKAATLARILEVTGQPVSFFFASAVDDPTAAEAGCFEVALAQILARALDDRVRPLSERIAELERQQAAEGWRPSGRRALTTRRAA